MDRGELSETIVHELSALFAAGGRAAGAAVGGADLDGMEQRVQQLSRRVCGALLERVLAVRAQAPAARPPCPACGGLLRPAQGAPDVVVAVDGCQVPLDDGWHEMKVGRVAPLGP